MKAGEQTRAPLTMEVDAITSAIALKTERQRIEAQHGAGLVCDHQSMSIVAFFAGMTSEYGHGQRHR